MKKELTYTEAFDKLETLVNQLEDGAIPLDKLNEKVIQANDLIAVCEDKLRLIEGEIKVSSKPSTKKKK
jgi:exodeoxyribonuclease VII small subunit